MCQTCNDFARVIVLKNELLDVLSHPFSLTLLARLTSIRCAFATYWIYRSNSINILTARAKRPCTYRRMYHNILIGWMPLLGDPHTSSWKRPGLEVQIRPSMPMPVARFPLRYATLLIQGTVLLRLSLLRSSLLRFLDSTFQGMPPNYSRDVRGSLPKGPAAARGPSTCPWSWAAPGLLLGLPGSYRAPPCNQSPNLDVAKPGRRRASAATVLPDMAMCQKHVQTFYLWEAATLRRCPMPRSILRSIPCSLPSERVWNSYGVWSASPQVAHGRIIMILIVIVMMMLMVVSLTMIHWTRTFITGRICLHVCKGNAMLHYKRTIVVSVKKHSSGEHEMWEC